jgi:hypothetical protein
MLGRGMLLSAITVCGSNALAFSAARDTIHDDSDADDSQALMRGEQPAARWTYGTVNSTS